MHTMVTMSLILKIINERQVQRHNGMTGHLVRKR